MGRRYAGAVRRSWSALRRESHSLGRSTLRPNCSHVPMPRCTPANTSERDFPPRGATNDPPLRDNIGGKLVCDKGDAVAQVEFALFQPLHLDNVGARRFLQRRNRGVEVAMLLLQARKLLPQLAFFLCCHCRPGCAGGGARDRAWPNAA